MSKQRFCIACAPSPNVVRRTAREAAGDVVMGFALRDTPTATMGRVTIARMIGMGRTLDSIDLQAMLDALAAAPNVGQQLVEDAVSAWVKERFGKAVAE